MASISTNDWLDKAVMYEAKALAATDETAATKSKRAANISFRKAMEADGTPMQQGEAII